MLKDTQSTKFSHYTRSTHNLAKITKNGLPNIDKEKPVNLENKSGFKYK